MRASFAAESTPVSLSQLASLPASVAVVDTSGSSLPVPGGVPGQDLSAQALALLASGTGFSLQSSLASTLFCQGRPAFVVLSFISTFASSNPSLASSQASLVAALPLSLVCPLLLLLIQCQSVINHLWSAQDSRRSQQKIITQIVSGKLVVLDELLSTNICLKEPEPQLLFDGPLMLTSGPKKFKHRIEEIASQVEAFSTFMLVLTFYFPHCWKDLYHYQLLILQTHCQFAGYAWLSYDRAFRQHAAATNLVDWSSINIQLFNFHVAGPSVHVRNDVSAGSLGPSGSITS